MDPVKPYLEMLEALRRRKRWYTETTMLRFAALTMATLDAPDRAESLERTAQELRGAAGWFSPLRSDLRYVVAALVLRRGVQAKQVHRAVEAALKGFRKRRLPRGVTRNLLAALLLVLHQDGGAVPAALLDRTAAILKRWKKDHFWLTGADDLPSAALHATGDRSPESIAMDVERVYQGLRGHGFGAGNALQFVSQLAAFDPRGVDEAMLRIRRVADALRKAGVRVSTSRYDEVALLALTGDEPARVVRTTLAYRDRLREARPRPSKEMALSLAAGLMLAGDTSRPGRLRKARDLAALQSVMAVLAARQAAAAAVAAAS